MVRELAYHLNGVRAFPTLENHRHCPKCRIDYDKWREPFDMKERVAGHVSLTIDGYTIVSQKFKDLLDNHCSTRLTIRPLANKKYYLFPEEVVLVNLYPGVRTRDYCDMCCRPATRLLARPEGDPPYVSELLSHQDDVDPLGLYRGHMELVTGRGKSHSIFVGDELAKMISAQKFKGVSFGKVIHVDRDKIAQMPLESEVPKFPKQYRWPDEPAPPYPRKTDEEIEAYWRKFGPNASD